MKVNWTINKQIIYDGYALECINDANILKYRIPHFK